MDARLQKRVQRYGWDRASAEYARYLQAQLESVQSRLLEIASLQAGEKVLDVACGNGLVSFRSAQAVGAEGLVVGDDISQEMVNRAEARRRKNDVLNLRFARRDAEQPVSDDEVPFDVALCALGLIYGAGSGRRARRYAARALLRQSSR